MPSAVNIDRFVLAGQVSKIVPIGTRAFAVIFSRESYDV